MARVMRFASTMLKNLFKPPVTTKYPAEPIQFPAGSRGHIEIEIDKCISCSLCALNCPAGAIKVDRKEGTWEINRMDCVQCGYCTLKCPKKCLHLVAGYTAPDDTKIVDHFQRDPAIMEAERKRKAEAAKKAAAAKKALAAKKAAAAKAAAGNDAAAKASPAGSQVKEASVKPKTENAKPAANAAAQPAKKPAVNEAPKAESTVSQEKK